MKICDVVQSYTHTSGGIKTYIDAKRRYLEARDGDQHVLIKPGPRDGVIREGNLTTYEIASRFVPGYKPYRFNYRIDKVLQILAREDPDVVEVACPYVMPCAAFIHRARRTGCVVVGYYHADYPRAYVGRIARRLFGTRTARLAEGLADRHARRIYRGCDLTVTAARIFATKLANLGVDNILELPLGVDLQTFCPARRDPTLRARLKIPSDRPLLIYSGRIDAEKRVDVLGDAMRLLPQHLGAHLVVMGAGPLRAEFEARAAAITRCLARDPRELGRRAHAYVACFYAWEQVFGQLFQAYGHSAKN